ncbi:MAG: ImmA/IrrE family metallo-endopeptidase, partial [Acidobacteriota bacterium]|nr:ImmA/IrrE family metallo-endopeptidase [Acidobacteriota bacterium]
MLIHIQMAGATYAAPPHRWLRDYGRRIRAGARPLVILQPKRPVMFVFDVSDTEPDEQAPQLPFAVERPFEVLGGFVKDEYQLTIENAKRDGVQIIEQKSGSQSAGAILAARPGKYLDFATRVKPSKISIQVPLRYSILLNASHSTEEKYATLIHELAHLYCGHLGTPNTEWWPDRTGLD